MEKLLPCRPLHLQILTRIKFQVTNNDVIDFSNYKWKDVVPFIFAMCKSTNPEQMTQAVEELERMATAADMFNEQILTNQN